MLVLSRQRDESIMIGDEIEITIVDVRGDKVRLGITAPTRIAVHRKEVYEAIKRKDGQAAQFNTHIQNGDVDVIRQTISPGPHKNKKNSPHSPSSMSRNAGAAPPRSQAWIGPYDESRPGSEVEEIEPNFNK